MRISMLNNIKRKHLYNSNNFNMQSVKLNINGCSNASCKTRSRRFRGFAARRDANRSTKGCHCLSRSDYARPTFFGGLNFSATNDVAVQRDSRGPCAFLRRRSELRWIGDTRCEPSEMRNGNGLLFTRPFRVGLSRAERPQTGIRATSGGGI